MSKKNVINPITITTSKIICELENAPSIVLSRVLYRLLSKSLSNKKQYLHEHQTMESHIHLVGRVYIHSMEKALIHHCICTGRAHPHSPTPQQFQGRVQVRVYPMDAIAMVFSMALQLVACACSCSWHLRVAARRRRMSVGCGDIFTA